MIIRRILMTLLLAQIALSQGGAAGSLHGTVVNGYTGVPFPGASVELLGIQHGRVISRSVRTDAKGEFHFQNVAPGSGYQLVVTGERFLATAYGQNTRNEPWVALTVDPGEEVRDLKIAVQPLAVIRGRVVDSQGRGLFGARVVALTPGYRGIRRVLQGSTTVVTNSRGDYQFSSMPAGVYYIRVMPSNSDSTVNTLLATPSRFDRAPQGGSPGGTTANPEGYPLTYFPSVVEVEMAKPVNLTAGGDADNTDITVTRVKTGRLRGSVTYDGTIVPTGQVVLQREGTAVESSWTRVAEIRAGQFDIRAVMPGTYILWTRTGESTGRLWGRTPVSVKAGETANVGVQVSPAPDISGRLAIEGWSNSTAPDFTQLSVYLVPDSPLPMDANLANNDLAIPSHNLAASTDGRFNFRGVPPWNYSVIVQPTQATQATTTLPNSSALRQLYVKSIRNNNSDVADKGLQLASTFDGGLDILLALDSGGLDGRIVAEGQENGGAARVVLVPEARHRWDLYLALMTSASGRFQLLGVPPGNYKIFAWKDAPDNSWYDADFLQAYENRGTPVQIAPGSAEYVELKRLQ